MPSPKYNWNAIIKKQFFQQPGEHMIVTGTTGTGKTNFLIYLMLGILANNPAETIVWLDIGKSSEILLLAQFMPVRVIVPRGMTFRYDIYDEWKDKIYDIHVVEADSYQSIWKLIKHGYINVISWKPYILRARTYTRFIGGLFETLIEMASDEIIPVPLSLFCDEFHLVVPEKGHQIDSQHYAAGAVVQLNIELLRSMLARIVGASQGYTKIRKGVRDEMGWKGIKRGCQFDSEEYKLRQFNRVFEKLRPDQAIIASPYKDFSDILTIPFYGRGRDIGQVHYIGKLDKRKHAQEIVNMADDEDAGEEAEA